VQIHDVHFPTSQPTLLEIRKGPTWVRDFEWLSDARSSKSIIPRIAAIVGRSLHILRVGESSDE